MIGVPAVLIERNNLVKFPYSESSLEKLVGVHPDLINLAFELANIIDCKLVYGVRTYPEQFALFQDKKSTFDGINKKSSHQVKEDGFGYALDILPLPVGINMYDDKDEENKIRWGQFDGLCQGIAYKLKIKIRTGFKWRNSMMSSLKRNEKENTLPDGNHVELVKS